MSKQSLLGPSTLSQWLQRIEQLHPREIDLGLERVRKVYRRLCSTEIGFPVITVAGTNGKGSAVAMLEAILGASGYKVGTYTSPHLLCYNERVRVGGQAVSNDQLCEAFEQVESARESTPLTYFEFGTLAAMGIFRSCQVEVTVLEVGLGGRLDAVNLFDADVALITSIGLDHTQWLGNNRESIGREKAGIFRSARPAVCADPNPPSSIGETARQLGTELYQLNVDFHVELNAASWSWRTSRRLRSGLPYPAMPGRHQVINAGGVLMVLDLLCDRFAVSERCIHHGLEQAALPGRFHILAGRPLRILDVAHNAQAAAVLAATLREQNEGGHTLAVTAMLGDKPIYEVLHQLSPVIHSWYLAPLKNARGASAEQLREALRKVNSRAAVQTFASVSLAYQQACLDAGANDRIVVFGSFYTVSDILGQLS